MWAAECNLYYVKLRNTAIVFTVRDLRVVCEATKVKRRSLNKKR